EPVPEAPVALYENGVELARSTTGADGTLRLSLDVNPNAFVAVETRTEDRYGVWYTANEPQPPSEDVYVYTERPIYRPGETVFFRGAYRARDDMDFNTQPSVETVFIRATANFGERVLLEENVTLTEFGTFSGEIPLPEDSPIGILELEVITPTQPFALGRTTAQIAEFRVPEFSVTVTPQEDEIIRGEPLRAVVSSEFFSGGPVNDAAVTWVANSTRSFFNYTGPGRYSFADDRLQDDFGGGFATDAEFFDPGFPGGGGGGQQIASGEGTTNDDGELLVSLGGEDQPLPDFGTQTRRVSIEATLNDESGQFISGRDAVIVHPSAVYVGVGINQYFASADEPFTADLITVNPQSDPVGGQRVTATLVRREWEEVPVEGQFGRFEYRQTEEEVASQRVTTDQNGRATVEFTPERPGIYLVRAATRDQLERLHSSSARLYVTGSEYVRWGQPNNRLELIADEDNYTPGDVAEVLVPLSLQGESHLLVSLERDGVISHEVVQVEGATHVVQVPITDEYAPVVYLSIVAVHGIDEDNSVPELREGTRALNVEPVNRRLDVRITPSSENAQPGDEITFDIEARTPQGEPTQAEVGLRMVDAAILTLAPPNSRSPEEHYYSSSGNFTATSVSLSALVDGRLDDAFEPEVIEQALNEARAMGADAELAADFAESAAAPEGMGGGGGGGGGFEDIAIREDFQQTPLWAPHIVTGEDGRASVSVTLPDNLTIWDVQARALTRDTLVDEVALEVASTLPLLVRPATPRFFVVGDEVELAMIVNNNTPDDQTVQTTIEGTGFELLDGEELEQAVEIASGQRARVTWQARILDVSGVDLTFFALGEDGYQDAARPQLATGEDDTIPVYRYTAPDTTGTAGVLREGGSRTEGVSVPPIADTDQGELTLQLDPSLAVTAIDGLDYLQNFEHQCIEQTVSRFLPNIMTYRALRALGVDDPALEARLVAALDFGLDRLRDSQNPDGGWGWFATMRSNPLVTAYAALGLIEAQNIGYYNDESAMLARALDYLRGEFITPTEDTPAWQLNRQAFFFYVFSRDEQQTRLTAAQMQPLFDVRLEMDYYARAYLMQALGTLEGTLSQMEALASDLYSAARLSATGAHWEEDNIDWWNWNTDVRSTAIILSTLVKWNPNNDLLPNVVRWLMIARQGTHWESTQNTAWAVMALTDWMVATRELEGDYAYALTLNDEALAEGDVSPETVREGQTLRVAVGDLLLDELNRVTVVREDGPGALYYTAHLRLRLNAAEVDALDRGIAVSREYFNAAGERVTRAQVGEVITVRLTINSPDVQYYFVLEDPLPAGAEAVDTSLLTASREIAGPQLQRQSDPRFYWWWWIWDTTEIRDESVNLYAERLPAGTYVYSYQMRASVPGRFQTMPSHAYNFYFPEVFGRGDGELFTVTPTEE
ncbi:MAG: alpha-2-macroglobulin family protein, partial [Anaerolineales bacterium]